MIRKVVLGVFAVLLVQVCSADNPYEFELTSKNDMRAAWMMCATTGFSGGICPKVLTKCWQKPLIYRKKHKWRTHCVKAPSFSHGSASEMKQIEQWAVKKYSFLDASTLIIKDSSDLDNPNIDPAALHEAFQQFLEKTQGKQE